MDSTSLSISARVNRLQTFLQLLEALVDLLPLTPLLVIFETTSNWQTSAVRTTHVPDSSESLFQANDAPARHQLLALADLELQVPELLHVFLRDAVCQAVVEHVEQTNDYFREAACQTVNGCHASNGEDRQEVLAETCEDGEVLMVDVGRRGDQSLVVDDTVGKLGAHDVGMGCKLLECRRCDVQVVCDTGVVVCE